MSYYREQLEKYLKTLDIKFNSLVDVGGKQKNLKGRTKSWDVGEYVVLDKEEFDLDVLQKIEKQYDAVFCLEVFEYLIEPCTAMKNLASLLKPGGFLLSTFPFVYPLHNEVEFDSLRYTISGVKRMATRAGLKLTKTVERKTKTKTLEQYYREDQMRAAQGHRHDITGYIVEFTK